MDNFHDVFFMLFLEKLLNLRQVQETYQNTEQCRKVETHCEEKHEKNRKVGILH